MSLIFNNRYWIERENESVFDQGITSMCLRFPSLVVPTCKTLKVAFCLFQVATPPHIELFDFLPLISIPRSCLPSCRSCSDNSCCSGRIIFATMVEACFYACFWPFWSVVYLSIYQPLLLTSS